jgi:hypothetical protein
MFALSVDGAHAEAVHRTLNFPRSVANVSPWLVKQHSRIRITRLVTSIARFRSWATVSVGTRAQVYVQISLLVTVCMCSL